MKIIIIRHGDPDYIHDSLTPKGDREAMLLSEIIDRYNIDAFYVSPLGRAQRTASFSLEKLGKTAETLDWLREFPPRIKRPDLSGSLSSCAWDWRPADWTKVPEFYDRDLWYTHPIMEEAHVKEAAIDKGEAFAPANGWEDALIIAKWPEAEDCDDAATSVKVSIIGLFARIMTRLPWSVISVSRWSLLPTSSAYLRCRSGMDL